MPIRPVPLPSPSTADAMAPCASAISRRSPSEAANPAFFRNAASRLGRVLSQRFRSPSRTACSGTAPLAFFAKLTCMNGPVVEWRATLEMRSLYRNPKAAHVPALHTHPRYQGLSSWSLRPYVALRHIGVAFDEQLVALRRDTTSPEILEFLAGRPRAGTSDRGKRRQLHCLGQSRDLRDAGRPPS